MATPWTAPTSSIRVAALAFQAQLAANDADAVRQARQAWKVADAAIQARQAQFLARIAAAQAQGTPISESWLYQVARLDQLQRFMASQYAAMGVKVTRSTTDAQARAISKATDTTLKLLGTGFRGAGVQAPRLDLAHLDITQLNYMVGQLATGSPLRDLTFSNLTAQATSSVTNALLAGVAAGESIRDIANRMALERNLTGARAVTIARTETLRVARQASLATMEANSHLLNGWRWSARLDGHTCGICISLQGELFPIGTPFDTHPNCRCAPVPQTKSWDELGYPDAKTETSVEDVLPKAADWWRGMSAADLRRAYGPTRASMIQGGFLSPSDLVWKVDRGRWGFQPRLKPVGELASIATGRGWTPPAPTSRQAPPISSAPAPAPLPRPNPALDKLEADIAARNQRIVEAIRARVPIADAFADSLKGMETGSKVTDAYWAKLRAPLKEALGLLDRVVKDGRLPSIVVRKLTGGRAGTLGGYRHTMTDPVDMQVRPVLGPESLDTWIHEIGHFVDHMGTGAYRAGNMASELGWNPGRHLTSGAEPHLLETARVFGGWADAVRGTSTYQGWTTVRDQGGQVRIVLSANQVFDGLADYNIRSYLQYSTKPVELFARSWSQYVALRTGNTTLRAMIDVEIANNSLRFWPWDDFQPIAQAMDRLIADMGWKP